MRIISSTSDSEEQIAAALEAKGMEASNPPSDPAEAGTEPKSEDPPPVPAGDGAPVQDGAAPPSESAPAPEPGEPTSQEEEEEEEDEESSGEPPHQEAGRRSRKGSRQRKVDRLNRELGQVSAEKAELQRQIDELKAKLAQPAPKEPEPAAPPAPAPPTAEPELVEPKPEDFEEGALDPKYIRAVAKYEAELLNRDLRNELKGLKTELAQRDQVDEQAVAAQERWEQRAAKAKVTRPDFDEVVYGNAAEQVQLTSFMIQAMNESEKQAEITYFFGKHPEEAKRIFEATNLPDLHGKEIAKMSPRDRARVDAAYKTALREIIRIEDRIDVDSKVPPPEPPKPPAPAPPAPKAPPAPPPPPARPEPRRVSQAEPPIEPVNGTTRATGPDPSKMDTVEYRRFMSSPEGKLWREKHNMP